jgi:hypothetical protein
MTTGPAFGEGDPRQLLAGTRELKHQVRHAQRATWFPLFVFAAVVLAAIPVDRYGHYATNCTGTLGPGTVSRICTTYSTSDFAYWPVAFVLAYVAIAAFYIRTSRKRGVGTRVWPYVALGLLVAAVVTGVAVWAALNPGAGTYQLLGLHVQARLSPFAGRLASTASAIGLSLLVLASTERNKALLLFTLGYLALVLVPVNFGWVMHSPSTWPFLPSLVIDGSVLVLGGVGFALARRSPRSSTRPGR